MSAHSVDDLAQERYVTAAWGDICAYAQKTFVARSQVFSSSLFESFTAWHHVRLSTGHQKLGLPLVAPIGTPHAPERLRRW